MVGMQDLCIWAAKQSIYCDSSQISSVRQQGNSHHIRDEACVRRGGISTM